MTYDNDSEDDDLIRYFGPTDADRARSERIASGASSRSGSSMIWRIGIGVVLGLAALSMMFSLAGPFKSGGNAADTRGQLTEATVVEVIDAQTISVRIDGDDAVVRYIGVDTPAIGEPLYGLARQANAQWVSGKTVLLEADELDTDPDGQLLRYVYVDDGMVNAALVANGLARVRVDAGNTRYHAQLLQLEQDARDARRGLWSTETERSTSTAPASADAQAAAVQ